MRVLITGARGMLGQDVVKVVGRDALALSRAELDITDPAAVNAAVQQATPDVVINCAAWTDVDGAEAAEPDAVAVNGAGAGNVARAASGVGAWTIHVSSDYVFDGLSSKPYLESDPVGPVSAYGRSKLEGELTVAREAPDRHTIVRSSWLFGTAGRCFPATIMRLAAERDQLTVVDDQVGCPTFTGDLAAALIELASASIPGLVHVAAGGSCSWFQFALAIIQAAGLECEVKPGSTAELARSAPRPPYSVLGTERGGPRLPDWREGLASYLTAMAVSA